VLVGALAFGLTAGPTACGAPTESRPPDAPALGAVEVAPGLRIHPRSDWDAGRRPTVAAQESLRRTLIWFADRYDVDTDPNATVTFRSRGSNKFRQLDHHADDLRAPRRDLLRVSRQLRLHAARWMAQPRPRHAAHAQRPGTTKRAVRLGIHLT